MSKNKIKKKALSLLSRRNHSKQELKYKLKNRGFSFAKIDEVLQELIEDGYLNDEKFAEEWIRNRIEKKPRGKALIKAELLEKNVDREIIDNKLDNLLSSEKAKEMAELLANKWLKKKREKDDKTKEKLYRYLKNKGFSSEIINEIMTDICL